MVQRKLKGHSGMARVGLLLVVTIFGIISWHRSDWSSKSQNAEGDGILALLADERAATKSATSRLRSRSSRKQRSNKAAGRELSPADGLDLRGLRLEDELWDRHPWSLDSWHQEAGWVYHLKPRQRKRPWGYVLFELYGTVEQHRPMIGDAAAVAYVLNAGLVLPSIREAATQPDSNFTDIYDHGHFTQSVDPYLRVVGRLPDEFQSLPKTRILVPRGATKRYVSERIWPVFKQRRVVQLAFAPRQDASLEPADPMNAVRCLVNNRALKFSPNIVKFGERMVERMLEPAGGAGGPPPAMYGGRRGRRRFIAIDVQNDRTLRSTCAVAKLMHLKLDKRQARLPLKLQRQHDRDCPLHPTDAGRFLLAVGYPRDTPLYLTVPRWDTSLNGLRELFPNTLTKEYTVPVNEEAQLLHPKTILEMALDLYVTSVADVFVPLSPGPFRELVTGQRQFAGFRKVLLTSTLSLFNTTGLPPAQAAAVLRAMHRSSGTADLLLPLRLPMDNATAYNSPTHFCMCRKGRYPAASIPLLPLGGGAATAVQSSPAGYEVPDGNPGAALEGPVESAREAAEAPSQAGAAALPAIVSPWSEEGMTDAKVSDEAGEGLADPTVGAAGRGTARPAGPEQVGYGPGVEDADSGPTLGSRGAELAPRGRSSNLRAGGGRAPPRGSSDTAGEGRDAADFYGFAAGASADVATDGSETGRQAPETSAKSLEERQVSAVWVDSGRGGGSSTEETGLGGEAGSNSDVALGHDKATAVAEDAIGGGKSRGEDAAAEGEADADVTSQESRPSARGHLRGDGSRDGHVSRQARLPGRVAGTIGRGRRAAGGAATSRGAALPGAAGGREARHGRGEDAGTRTVMLPGERGVSGRDARRRHVAERLGRSGGTVATFERRKGGKGETWGRSGGTVAPNASRRRPSREMPGDGWRRERPTGGTPPSRQGEDEGVAYTGGTAAGEEDMAGGEAGDIGADVALAASDDAALATGVDELAEGDQEVGPQRAGRRERAVDALPHDDVRRAGGRQRRAGGKSDAMAGEDAVPRPGGWAGGGDNRLAGASGGREPVEGTQHSRGSTRGGALAHRRLPRGRTRSRRDPVRYRPRTDRTAY